MAPSLHKQFQKFMWLMDHHDLERDHKINNRTK